MFKDDEVNKEGFHYICRDSEGGLFMTTEKCVKKEDAEQYVGNNEVLYPFDEEAYIELLKERKDEMSTKNIKRDFDGN